MAEKKTEKKTEKTDILVLESCERKTKPGKPSKIGPTTVVHATVVAILTENDIEVGESGMMVVKGTDDGKTPGNKFLRVHRMPVYANVDAYKGDEEARQKEQEAEKKTAKLSKVTSNLSAEERAALILLLQQQQEQPEQPEQPGEAPAA